MKCRYCGNDLLNGAMFCEYCGARVVVENVYDHYEIAPTQTSEQYVDKGDYVVENQTYEKKLENQNFFYIEHISCSYSDISMNGRKKRKKPTRKEMVRYLAILALIMIFIAIYNLGKTSLSGQLTFIWIGIGPLVFCLIGIGLCRNILLTICGFLNTLFMNHFLFGKFSRGLAELALFGILLLIDQLLSLYVVKYRTEF